MLFHKLHATPGSHLLPATHRATIRENQFTISGGVRLEAALRRVSQQLTWTLHCRLPAGLAEYFSISLLDNIVWKPSDG